MVAELVMERIAQHLGRTPLEVREPHLYKDGDVTHFGMVSGIQASRGFLAFLRDENGDHSFRREWRP